MSPHIKSHSPVVRSFWPPAKKPGTGVNERFCPHGGLTGSSAQGPNLTKQRVMSSRQGLCRDPALLPRCHAQQPQIEEVRAHCGLRVRGPWLPPPHTHTLESGICLQQSFEAGASEPRGHVAVQKPSSVQAGSFHTPQISLHSWWLKGPSPGRHPP